MRVEPEAWFREAVRRLREAGVEADVLAQRACVRTRWLVTKRERLVETAKVWPLGVLLLTKEGNAFYGGETVRAVPPLHPGHVSVERERRRALTRLAFESGFPRGTTIHVDASPVSLPSTTDAAGPISSDGGSFLVRWNPRDRTSMRPLEAYVREQVELILDRHQRRTLS